MQSIISNRQQGVRVTKQWLHSICGVVLAALVASLKARPAKLRGLKPEELETGVVAITLVSNREIRRLNRTFRGQDRATDVLSFPQLGEVCQKNNRKYDKLHWPRKGRLELGDIVISMEKARQQARHYGHPLEQEVAFLITHGALHLLGFDHATARQERVMFARQKAILKDAGFRT